MILNGDNADFLEGLYQKYKKDTQLVDSQWRDYFANLELSNGSAKINNGSLTNGLNGLANDSLPYQSLSLNQQLYHKEVGVQSLIESYRRFGNLAADLDPVGLRKINRELLQIELYGLNKNDLEKEFSSPIPGLSKAKLSHIIAHLEKTYCASIGVEYAYVRNTQERNWLEQRMEETANSQTLAPETRLHLYEKLIQAESLEKFLAQKYVGKKRFSIEGCETFIPLLDTAIEEGAKLGIKCMVIGMAHRGRLNVLVNILKKPASLIFAEFDENYNPKTLDYGDVKYHLGHSYDRPTKGGNNIHLSLTFNPSHLEAVNPVVLGSVRARQTKAKDQNRKAFMPILVHGDAAFMGQGVVSESLNLCNLSGYSVDGTLHILINNQIGFTTLPPESRSTEYATDLAKGFQIPIFHVNADDPEAAYRATKLGLEYRQTFGKDVIIDMIGYRRLGHNETDEPAFTQPVMYAKIKQHPTTVNIYHERLNQSPDINQKQLQEIDKRCHKDLQENFDSMRSNKIYMKVDTMKGAWSDFSREGLDSQPQTQLLTKQLEQTVQALTKVPQDFNIHPKLNRVLEERKKMYKGEVPINWGFAEALAFGSILKNKYNIRLSGQDTKRGTFSHRHAVLTDAKTGTEYVSLNHICSDQGYFEVCNSPLSEFSVLGFEYGYSLADPQTLVLWEAQFGDFANSAQIIFDQFISSSEVKWHRMSGLVILLPHGYEGQGPEHSSARLERFLQLCADDNMQVCNCSTPAQYFHLLRRQILRKFRKPLIIMTPKSLLRLPEAGSTMADISNKGLFQEVLYDIDTKALAKAKRILLCSGKVYYDLIAYKNSNDNKNKKVADIFIARLEQLYPFPQKKLQDLFEKCTSVQELFWIQEEPINQGAWFYIREPIEQLLKKGQKLRCLSRPESASPAAGLFTFHKKQQTELVSKAYE